MKTAHVHIYTISATSFIWQIVFLEWFFAIKHLMPHLKWNSFERFIQIFQKQKLLEVSLTNLSQTECGNENFLHQTLNQKLFLKKSLKFFTKSDIIWIFSFQQWKFHIVLRVFVTWWCVASECFQYLLSTRTSK